MVDISAVRQQKRLVIGVANTNGYALLESLRPMLRDPLPRVGVQLPPDFAAAAARGVEDPLFTPLINYLNGLGAEVVGLAPRTFTETLEKLEMALAVVHGRQTLAEVRERVALLRSSTDGSPGELTLSFEYESFGYSSNFLSALVKSFEDAGHKPNATIVSHWEEANFAIAAHLAGEIANREIGVAVLEERHAGNIMAFGPHGFEFDYLKVSGQ